MFWKIYGDTNCVLCINVAQQYGNGTWGMTLRLEVVIIMEKVNFEVKIATFEYLIKIFGLGFEF